MNEKIPNDLNLELEKRERDEQRKQLESTAEFSKLSKNQQKYILATLYIQQRAERGTDKISTSHIMDIPEDYKDMVNSNNRKYITHSEEGIEDYGKYEESQLYIMTKSCHQAIKDLEGYSKSKSRNEIEWTDVGAINSFEDLLELINIYKENNDFPAVIQIKGNFYVGGSSREISIHETVLIGKYENGDFIVWEKAGFHIPFQLTSIKNIYNSYKEYTVWKIRPLVI